VVFYIKEEKSIVVESVGEQQLRKQSPTLCQSFQEHSWCAFGG